MTKIDGKSVDVVLRTTLKVLILKPFCCSWWFNYFDIEETEDDTLLTCLKTCTVVNFSKEGLTCKLCLIFLMMVCKIISFWVMKLSPIWYQDLRYFGWCYPSLTNHQLLDRIQGHPIFSALLRLLIIAKLLIGIV